MYLKTLVIVVGCMLSAAACGGAAESGQGALGPTDVAGNGATQPAGGTLDPATDPATTPGSGSASDSPDPGSAPVDGTAGAEAPFPTEPGAVGDAYDYEAEEVALTADLVVAQGATLRVGPRTTFTASSGVAVRIAGTLVVEGAADAPVRFLGAGVPSSWHGIVVESGGVLVATNVEIGGATYGVHAQPGSDFTVEEADIGTSFKAAVLESDGSFDRTRFHASGNPLFSAVNEASIDDVNGTLTVLGASPTVTNSTFDNSGGLVDMIRVGGGGAPLFDHIHVTSAHCGIHTFGDVPTSLTVTNSVFEGLAYGFMAYATAPVIENSVFLSNGNDVGFCFGATTESRPILRGNYYSAGSALVDPTCFQVGTQDESPASAPNPAAGAALP